MLCRNGFGTEGISKIFLPLTSAMLKASPGDVKVGRALAASTVATTSAETAPSAAAEAAADAGADAAAEAATEAAADAAALAAGAEVSELVLLLEQALIVNAVTAIRAIGKNRRDVYIDTP